MLTEKARSYVENMLVQVGPHFESCLDELRLLGSAEIEQSSKIKPLELDDGFYVFTKALRKVAKPSFWSKLINLDTSVDYQEMEVFNGKGVLEIYLDKARAHRDEVQKHVKRLNALVDVASELLDCVYVHMLPNSMATISEPERILLQRKQAILTHVVVLHQAYMATCVIIDNTLELIQAAETALTTNRLARNVNDSVRKISKNDALTLEPRTAERRSSYPVLELYDARGRCYYREDGRGKHHLVSESYTRAELGRQASREPGLGKILSRLDEVDDA